MFLRIIVPKIFNNLLSLESLPNNATFDQIEFNEDMLLIIILP